MPMTFETIRPHTIVHVLRFSTDIREWKSLNKEHILAYEISGHSFHQFADKTYEVKDDSLMFFNKKDKYTVRDHVGEGCYSIHFLTEKECTADSFVMDVSNNKKIFSAFEKMYHICLAGADCNSFAAMAQLYTLLDLAAQAYNAQYTKTDKKLEKIITFLNSNHQKNISVEELALEYGVSPRRFNDIFKNKTGLTPNSYIIDLRINKAKDLLKLGYIPINEISCETGFSDVTYFSRLFKSKTGLTPSQYRKITI
ncbi:MAG: helix-turn-helix transcriptional regulator [Clostridia bacterium]|nr:helix-turn-helix transcriptional regulator [Clostridia bacterium]